MRPPRMDTAQLSLVRQPFDHPDFLFELKHDGFRALAHIWDGQCELVSRKRNAYKSFEELRDNFAKPKVKNTVIDGELVCLIPKDAAFLMNWFSEGNVRLSMPLICCI
jgi:bifunctional non-homologous end joining protein LigD